MKIAFTLGILVILWGLAVVQVDKMDQEYRRGFEDGAKSVKRLGLDNACVGWWFETSMAEAKKRICGK